MSDLLLEKHSERHSKSQFLLLDAHLSAHFTKDRMSDVTQQWGLFSLCLFLDNYICIQRVSQIFRYISIYKSAV